MKKSKFKSSRVTSHRSRATVTGARTKSVTAQEHWWDIFLTDDVEKRDSKAHSPYKQVSLVFTCVNKLINGIQSLPLVLSTIDEKIVESGPVYDLLFNSKRSWDEFVSQTIGHYALTNDVFWIFLDDAGNPDTGGVGSRVKEIFVVSGAQMHEVTDNNMSSGELIGWEFRGAHGERQRFAFSEVWQWKGFNPYNKFHGLAPTKAAANDINYTFAAALYNASTLANGAEPGAILTTPGKLDDDQVRMLREQFDARHRGAGQAKRTALLTGGLDVKTIAMKLADLEVANITSISDKKICSTFGVPPGVAGLITEAQYSHGPAMCDFIYNTILPLASVFAGQITRGIIERFTESKCFGDNFPGVARQQARFYSGNRSLPFIQNRFYRGQLQKAVRVRNKIFAWFDATQHPVVQDAMTETAEKVLKFTQSGVPLNNLIEAHDLPYELTEAGKYFWTGMGNVPADYILAAGLEGLTGPSLPEGQTPGEEEPARSAIPAQAGIRDIESRAPSDESRRLRIWRAWTMSWSGIEKEFESALRIYFVNQQKDLIKKLKQVVSEPKSASDESRATNDEIIARVIFDLKVENNKISVINRTFFEKASELGVRQVLREVLNLSGGKLNEAAGKAKQSQWLRGKLLISCERIKLVNHNTRKIIAAQLKAGLEAGETVNDLAGRIRNKLGENRNRALSIARTQTSGAVGSGRHLGLGEAGVELKGWLDSRDTSVRDSHKAAGQQYAKGIPVNTPFIVGNDELMFPGDPSGSAAEIINCRCAEIAIKAAGKFFGLDYYENIAFYSFADMQRDKL